MSRRDAADILGIREDASVRAIKMAYRKLAIKWHPDKNPGDEDATAMFQMIGNAYETLCRERQIVCEFFSSEDFLYAADEGDLEEVQALLEADVDIFTTNKWAFTALHKAAQRGHWRICEVLCSHPAGPNLVKKQIRLGGSTALHLAAEKGHFRVIEVLLRCCSSPDFINTKDRNTGMSAMQIAQDRLAKSIKYGGNVGSDQMVVDLLQRYGAE